MNFWQAFFCSLLVSLPVAVFSAFPGEKETGFFDYEERFMAVLEKGFPELLKQTAPGGRRELLAELLKRASVDTEGSLERQLKGLIDDLQSGDLRPSLRAWIDGQPSGLVLLIDPEAVADGFDQILVLKVDGEAESRPEKLFSALREMEIANMPTTMPNVFAGGKKPFRVADLLLAVPSFSRYGSDFTLVTPASGKGVGEVGFTITFLRNFNKEHFEKNVLPLWRSVFTGETKPEPDFPAYFSVLMIHRLAHCLGPVFTRRQSETPETVAEALRDLAAPAEEIKAWSISAASLPELEQKKLLKPAAAAAAEQALLAALLADLHPEAVNARRIAAIVILQYLLQKGAILYDLQEQKLHPDEKGIARSMKELAEIIVRMQFAGAYRSLDSFLQPLRDPQSVLLELNRHFSEWSFSQIGMLTVEKE